MEMNTPGDVTVALVSDIHYAGAAERACGEDYELRAIANPLLRAFARAYRHLIWMRHPLDQGRQLDRFLAEVGPVDYLVLRRLGQLPLTWITSSVSNTGSVMPIDATSTPATFKRAYSFDPR